MKTSKKKPARKKRDRKKSERLRVVTVPLGVVAEAMNLSKRRVQQLVKDGLPRVDRGKYDLRECFRFYIRYLQRKIIERALGTDDEPTAAATRHTLLSVESELKQIQLTKLREQFISRDRFEKDLAAIVREIRRSILALSPRIASEVLGCTDIAVAQVKVDRELKVALQVLSVFDPDQVEPTRSRTQ